MTSTVERAHATLGASSSKRWMNCPGSVELSRPFPDTTSKYAIEGTIAHGLGEWCIQNGVKPHDFVGVEIATDGISGVPTEEMATAVKVFVDEVFAQLQHYGPDASWALEERFSLQPLGPPAPMFGTADVTIWSGDHLHVIDYKHGQGVVVEVEKNTQLMYYALGASVAAGRVPATVDVTIVQPRAPHSEGPVRTYSFDRDELIAFKHLLFEAAARTKEADAPLAPGDWCRFCKAAPVCPAKKAEAESVAMTVFSEDVEDVPTAPRPEALTGEQLRLVLDKGSGVMQWIRDVEAYALSLMEDGHTVPGFKLVRGRSNRKWTDSEAASKYLGRKGVPAAKRYTKKLVSPNAAEKALKALGHDITFLERFWEKPEGAAKIAPEADDRPALPPAAERVFGPAEELDNIDNSEEST